ncbi:GNAT family N-acetyltransferase [Halapricum hydrolyticum]|uniref:GNAT family N-acetyltransferase n=1 Tax=Halapricum hydrolyticum TaxID=2979991 RepID=A0AAE3LEF4_9EURY|nr:GNAT family N-acetyltransferase [Halapricum hydrolyticum]MCU4716471.1 GNAT family N-acetyltransferase [Halapricum hydrolyticum]MCU4725925.1 GNAT family N-acetyltransferase [Halapricum hydrolyticum]
MTEPRIRRARADDHEDVVAFTRETWSDRDVEDYIPDAFEEWVETDGPEQRTVVVEVDGSVVGVCQGVVLSEHEAWLQGMRVDPDHRGSGIALSMMDDLLSWAREQGASVARDMVFSWNGGGLGLSRAAGFGPATEGRWAQPAPDPSASPGLERRDDPDAAWSHWQRSDARDHLSGLGVDTDEPWSLSEVTRERLHEDCQRVISLRDETGTRATTARIRQRERNTDDGVETWAVYGHSAWDSPDAARALFDAVAADAADLGVDHTRVLIPETCRHVSVAAAADGRISDEPFFVLEADLTGSP